MSSIIDEIITEPQQASRYIYNLLLDSKESLGIEFLGIDERLKPAYPAVVVYSGGKEKAQHSTHVFLVYMQIVILVYHARLTESHSTRTENDLNLVTDIENTIETGDMNFGGKIVFAYVSQTAPITGSRRVSDAIVGTEMIVSVETRKGFPYGP